MSEAAVPAWKIKKCCHVDVSELIDRLPTAKSPVALQGQSAAQIKYGASVRENKLQEWDRLDDTIHGALMTIADATWWIANKDADTENIGWPEQWVTGTGQPTLNEEGQYECPGCGMGRDLVSKFCGNPACPQFGGKPIDPTFYHPTFYQPKDIDQFLEFARKAAMSPELAFLTMLALVYRQTKDPKVLAKFTESRLRVKGHLDAIDEILGSPGE